MSDRGQAWVAAGVAAGLMVLIAIDAWGSDYPPDRILARALAANLAIGFLGGLALRFRIERMDPVFLVMGVFQLMLMGVALAYGIGSPGPVLAVSLLPILFLVLAAWFARRARL